MACAIGNEMESLQATLDFIANFDIPQIGFQGETAILDVINEDRELLALGETLEADVSLNELTLDKFSHGLMRGDKNAGKCSPTSSHVDVASLATDAPWPEVSPQPNKRRRRGPSRKDEIADLSKVVTSLSKKLKSLQASAQVADAARAKGETKFTHRFLIELSDAAIVAQLIGQTLVYFSTTSSYSPVLSEFKATFIKRVSISPETREIVSSHTAIAISTLACV
ncbi:hypothetical protein PR002_g3730 [Phytophthora rubi]|uniref:Uncharacterized protein n=1 Tax=Phytophthora rubi TaxID=129364 RepID=A0A6A3NQM0_9STRA|nr:hypothetical protein PR002_g3730 [Phytophthora rubi]